MRRKKLTEGPLHHELAYQLKLLKGRVETRQSYNIVQSINMQFSSLTFAVLLCAASGTLAQNQPKDKYKCYVPFDTCSKPIPAELKASMAKEFGARSECRLTEVVYYGAPDAAIEGVYCEPGPVRSMGGTFRYSVGRVSTVCHSKCEIWG
ncbi:hypothetical protein BDP81DRAFT_450052 [Colletotrichum phormii]|uniref:Uncharacterized protein n=1 Tax=Colletotrichum phormii TaxID=359342 RepID=A0AAJ0EEQ8_9PEZI|nr:uncharacterized protein BDP81DRAFT_450052 [Colletotrichum phormii]KAK1636113.1 hypothetical protein BDP81DRAFT_450052 [Colletotrichum phormii]